MCCGKFVATWYIRYVLTLHITLVCPTMNQATLCVESYGVRFTFICMLLSLLVIVFAILPPRDPDIQTGEIN